MLPDAKHVPGSGSADKRHSNSMLLLPVKHRWTKHGELINGLVHGTKARSEKFKMPLPLVLPQDIRNIC